MNYLITVYNFLKMSKFVQFKPLRNYPPYSACTRILIILMTLLFSPAQPRPFRHKQGRPYNPSLKSGQGALQPVT